jgi:hypothetical protein
MVAHPQASATSKDFRLLQYVDVREPCKPCCSKMPQVVVVAFLVKEIVEGSTSAVFGCDAKVELLPQMLHLG